MAIDRKQPRRSRMLRVRRDALLVTAHRFLRQEKFELHDDDLRQP